MIAFFEFFYLLILIKQHDFNQLQSLIRFNNQSYLPEDLCKNMIVKFVKATSESINFNENKKYSLVTEIKNFWSFNEIQFNCIDSSDINFILLFIPNKYLILDSSIGFDFGEKKLQTNILSASLYLSFSFIQGFEIQKNIFSDIFNYYKNLKISFYYSNFFLFHQNKLLKNCSSTQNFSEFLAGIDYLDCTFTTKYQNNMCSLIFFKSVIDTVRFSGLSTVFLKQNMLSFYSVNRSIQNKVDKLFLDSYRIVLDDSLLSPEIFNQVSLLSLNGLIRKIEAKTLDNFKKLKLILIILDDLRFFISNGLDWLNTIEVNDYLAINIQTKSYLFPDEDLCLFKNLILNPKLFFFFTAPLENCTCTLAWLHMSFNSNYTIFSHFHKYNNLMNTFISSISSVCWSDESKIIKKCSFNESFQRCDLRKSIESKKNSYDTLYLSEFFNFFTLIFIPLVSLVGIITNLVSIKILLNIIKKDIEKKSMYTHLTMLTNSIVNLLYFFIFILHLMNKCIFPTGIFCSKISKNYFVQLFDIIFVGFFLNCLKIWSNITIVLLSWTRFANVINAKFNFFKKKGIMITRLKISISVFLILSFIFSVDKFFSSVINTNYFIGKEEYYVEFPNKNTFQNKMLRLRSLLNIDIKYYGIKSYIFFALFILNFLVNDLFLIILIVVTDIAMLFFLKKQIDTKKSIIKRLFKQKNEKVNNKTGFNHKHITLTIVVNLFIVFLLKLVHLCFSIQFMVVKLTYIDKKNYCVFNSRICTNYLEFGELIYSISNIYTIILFYNLNRNFKDEFKRIFFI